MACVNNCEATRPLSVRMIFAVVTNQMEERVLKNKLGSIEEQEKRLLRRYRSETRLLKTKQEQRVGTSVVKRSQDTKGTHIKRCPSPKSPEVCTRKRFLSMLSKGLQLSTKLNETSIARVKRIRSKGLSPDH